MVQMLLGVQEAGHGVEVPVRAVQIAEANATTRHAGTFFARFGSHDVENFLPSHRSLCRKAAHGTVGLSDDFWCSWHHRRNRVIMILSCGYIGLGKDSMSDAD
jgi:hypothetical protein